MASSLGKVPELNKRILFTCALLIVYRIGVYIPTPGIDAAALAGFFEQARGTLLDMATMFTGGALENFSVFALGIMPYISASIILQLLTAVMPQLESLKKEGARGQEKITTYTRYLTVVLSAIQGFMIAVGLESMSGPGTSPIVLHGGWSFRIMTMITLTGGSVFIMWLGEQITERGVGNGISLIIFANIVARFPSAFVNMIKLIKAGEMNVLIAILLIIMMFAVIAFIVFFESAQRKIPIQYPKRVVGRKVMGGGTQHLPMKVNAAGVIPPIFASSILFFPATIVQFTDNSVMQGFADMMNPGGFMYNLVFIIATVFFTFFYTAIQYNPKEIADNLKKNGGFIPGIRPGANTATHLDMILTRLTFWGAIYLAGVCVLPSILIWRFNVPFYFGGTSLLIVVGVAIDTAQQAQSHMLSRNYDGLMKKGKGKSKY